MVELSPVRPVGEADAYERVSREIHIRIASAKLACQTDPLCGIQPDAVFECDLGELEIVPCPYAVGSEFEDLDFGANEIQSRRPADIAKQLDLPEVPSRSIEGEVADAYELGG
jgi:hypothetical protein